MKTVCKVGLGMIVFGLALATTTLSFSEDLASPGRALGLASGSASVVLQALPEHGGCGACEDLPEANRSGPTFEAGPEHGGIAREAEQAPIANRLGASEDQSLVSPHGPPHLKNNDSVAGRIGHKLIRGVANTVTGWVEMPKQMYLKTTQGPPVIGTLQGIVEGVGLGFARTTAGLYEIATFPVPLPMHYEPLFQPEYVWQDEEEKEPD